MNFVEMDIDFDYCGEVEMVVAHDECGEHEDVEFYRDEIANRKIRKLEKDNLRLKILIRDMYKILSALDIDYCGACPQDNVLYPCPRYTIHGGDCKFETAMRELGMEGK